MIARLVVVVALLAAGCVSSHPQQARYDFDSVHPPADPPKQLDATIVVANVVAPSWLRSTNMNYRLEYSSGRPQPYGSNQWTAPPSELVTRRLFERLSATNAGFTLARPPPAGFNGYRLDVTLEHFIQVFSSPTDSHCLVTLSAILMHANQLVAERTFTAERPAASNDARGGAHGLVEATDDDIDQLLTWLRFSLQSEPSSKTASGPAGVTR